MAPPSTEQQAQLDAALRHLEKAVHTAQAYMSNEVQVAEVVSIHVNFLTQRILGVEKVVSSINRRNKNEDLLIPEAAEEASDLVRDMQIKRVELLRVEKERERQDAATHQAQLSAPLLDDRSSLSGAPLLVVKKPPLPPLPIPRFAGDAMLYHNFVTVFDETIHKNDTLAPSQKLIYLQSYVDGDARKLIGNILVTDANYDVARKVLQTNFGHTSQNITVLYDQLHDVTKARNDPFSIRDTFNEVENILQMLEHAGVNVNEDQYLRHEVMKKWPWPLIRQLVRSTEITLEEFRQELSKEVILQIHLTQATGYVQPQQQRSKPYADRPSRSKNFVPGGASAPTSGVAHSSTGRPTYSAPTSGVAQPPYTSAATSSKIRPDHPKAADYVPSAEIVAMPKRSASCTFCKEQHYAEECEKYKTVQQRLERLEGRCKKCFRAIHDGTPCLRNMQCRYCPSWDHNRAICPAKYGDNDPKYLFIENGHQRDEDAAGLFMTLLIQVANPETNEETGMRVLVDPACNRTAMTEQAARRIGISTTNKRKRAAKGMGERQVEPVTEESVKIKLKIQEEEPVEIAVRLTAKIANDVPTYDVDRFRQQYPHCGDYYIPPTGAGCPVDIIIGSDKLLRFLTLQNCIYIHQTCQLLSTKFGWLIMAENTNGPTTDENLLTFLTKDEESIRTMYDLDLVGMKGLEEAESEYEERALKIFYDSIKYVNNRYEVHWPWRFYPPNLNENYGLAMGRLKNLLKKLKEQPKLLLAYHQIIEEQISDDVVEDVPKGDREGVIHYIPHHAVVVLEKSTPIRVVYDGSATCGKSRSLNSSILKGTKWLGNTVGSLVRFRRFGQAVTADIKRAFHQIAIAPVDRNAVRFIWVHNIDKPAEGENLRILRFKRVAFGIVASPFLLYATIQYHLRENATKYADVLCREMYADNLLASLPTNVDVADFYQESKRLFNGMSMNLTKWRTNVHHLMELIPTEDQLTEEEICAWPSLVVQT